MLDAQDKRFLRNLVLAFAGVVVVVLAAIFAGTEHQLVKDANQDENTILERLNRIQQVMIFGQPAGGQGDTPAVLIGGSLTFKTEARIPWSQSGSGYSLTPKNPIASIAIEEDAPPDTTDNPDPDDNKGLDDAAYFDVSDADRWEIDVFADSTNQVASVNASTITAGKPYPIQLTSASGKLCDISTSSVKLTRLGFSPDGSCSQASTQAATFDHFVLSVYKTINNKQSILTYSGTFHCNDTKHEDQKCRVVLRSGTSSASRP